MALSDQDSTILKVLCLDGYDEVHKRRLLVELLFLGEEPTVEGAFKRFKDLPEKDRDTIYNRVLKTAPAAAPAATAQAGADAPTVGGAFPDQAAAGAGGAGAAGGIDDAPPAKRRRVGPLHDVSRAWVQKLVEQPMEVPATAEAVRNVIDSDLPDRIIDSPAGSIASALMSAPDGLPIAEAAAHPFETMTDLVLRIVPRLQDDPYGDSEMDVARFALLFTGDLWTFCDRLIDCIPGMVTGTDIADHSGVTQAKLRPDFCLWADSALLAKAEFKKNPEGRQVAERELTSKMAMWNPVVMRGLPLLPCFTVGGTFLQFHVIVPASRRELPPTCESVSKIFNLRHVRGRAAALRASFNMLRVLVALNRHKSAVIAQGLRLRLFVKQERTDGESVTLLPDAVEKICIPAPPAVYRHLGVGAGSTRLPYAIWVESMTPLFSGSDLWRLIAKPVCLEVQPVDEGELRDAVRCVLTALAAFHKAGLVHRDVRWPNVLRDPTDGPTCWRLADFELAGTAGTIVPTNRAGTSRISRQYLPPENRDGDVYTTAGDVWCVGKLLSTWSRAYALSAAALAFAQRLTAEDAAQRPSPAALLEETDGWLSTYTLQQPQQ